jgi:hypothetical protein
METKTGYAAVHGLKMYYRIQGSGPPLVLLNVALSNIETDFGRLLPEFTTNRKVVAIEQQAHGHTGDIDRPLSYAQMAADTAELLRQLKIEKADFLGYSMGGGIALELAMRHAALVRKLVWGVNYTPDGIYTVVRDGAKDLKPELLAGSPWQKAYTSIAPDRRNGADSCSRSETSIRILALGRPRRSGRCKRRSCLSSAIPILYGLSMS